MESAREFRARGIRRWLHDYQHDESGYQSGRSREKTIEGFDLDPRPCREEEQRAARPIDEEKCAILGRPENRADESRARHADATKKEEARTDDG